MSRTLLITVFSMAICLVPSLLSAASQYQVSCREPANNNSPYGRNYWVCGPDVTVSRAQKYVNITVHCVTNKGKNVQPDGPPVCNSEKSFPVTKSTTINSCYMRWGDNPPNASVKATVSVYYQCCAVAGTCKQ